MSGAASSDRARRRRPDRRAGPVPPPPAPYLVRRVPPYEILSDEGLALIESKADRLLEEVGVDVRGDPVSLELFRAAGAEVRGERIRFPAGLCRSIIKASAPARFRQHARNPARSVEIGAENVVFVPAYGAPFVRGLDIERRYSTLEDFNRFVMLSQASPHLHHSGGTIVEPTDIPVSKRHLDMVYGHVRYSDKPYMGPVTSGERAEDCIRMTEIVFGREFVANNCCTVALININSPLVLDATMLDALRVYAGHGQATLITPFVIGGASGPVSPAAMLTQTLAEALAGIALTQLVRPGAPVIFGLLVAGMNMRSGAPARFDETWKCLLAGGQLARRLGVPYRCGGMTTTAKIPDAHAGMEGAVYLTHSLLAGVNFQLHATGTCEGGLCLSYEKFVLDCHLLGAMGRMLTGIELGPDEFGLDALAEAGPGGNFLNTRHTLARYRDAFYETPIFDSTSFEQWRDGGSLDAAARANIALKSILASYEPPPLDAAVDEALRAFMAERKAVLPDSFA
jgi:trimethylamine--corrinoid protein Co-methyltransferase